MSGKLYFPQGILPLTDSLLYSVHLTRLTPGVNEWKANAARFTDLLNKLIKIRNINI